MSSHRCQFPRKQGFSQQAFPVPGGIDAARWTKYREQYRRDHKKEVAQYQAGKNRMHYYLSRYQLWDYGRCRGKMLSGSCAFGVADISYLIKKPHLVAHKLYIDFEPAAYFCGLKVRCLADGRKTAMQVVVQSEEARTVACTRFQLNGSDIPHRHSVPSGPFATERIDLFSSTLLPTGKSHKWSSVPASHSRTSQILSGCFRSSILPAISHP